MVFMGVLCMGEQCVWGDNAHGGTMQSRGVVYGQNFTPSMQACFASIFINVSGN